jgi:hypothetical protein
MPELARIDSIIIRLFFHDTVQHHQPHIHAKYAEYAAVYSIEGGKLAGVLPAKQEKILLDWLLIHHDEVKTAWLLAVNDEHFSKID